MMYIKQGFALLLVSETALAACAAGFDNAA